MVLSYIYEFNLVDACSIMFLLLTWLQAELELESMSSIMLEIASAMSLSRTASGNMISSIQLKGHGLHRYDAKARKT